MAYVGVKPAAITSATQAEISGDLTVDTNTLKVDATNNRVGVGLTAPEQPFHVRSSTFAYMRSESTNATYTGLDVGQHQSGYGVINMRDNQDIRLYTNDAEKLRIQAAGGISFNGDTAAANALSDFETGNWTYTASSNITLTSSTGKYTKVGNLVTAIASIAGVAFTNGNECIIGGLPFAPAVGNTPVLVVINNGGTFGYTPRARTDTASTVKFRAPATDNNLNVMVQAIYQV